MCLVPFFVRKYSNSWLVKTLLLSVTKVTGIDNDLQAFIFWMVAAEVADSTMCASSHLLCASIIRRNIFPMNGPAYSLHINCTMVVQATPKGVRELLLEPSGVLAYFTLCTVGLSLKTFQNYIHLV